MRSRGFYKILHPRPVYRKDSRLRRKTYLRCMLPAKMFVSICLLLSFVVTGCEAVCGGTFANLTGTVQSPNYPDVHGHNLSCTYLITAPAGYRITLNFTELDLEDSFFSSACPFDYVEIRDGGDETAPSFGRYCSPPIPFVRRSFGNKLWLKFVSDASIAETGFSATYTAEKSSDTFLLLTSSGKSYRNNDGAIFRVDSETISNYRVPFNTTLDHPIAVDYDGVKQRIYWTENGVDLIRIRSSFLNGTDVKTVVNGSSTALFEGIAVDHLSRLVFYTDAGNKRIAMVTMSTFAHKTVLSTGPAQPRAIVLDPRDGVVFWTDWGAPAKIERASYNGSDRRAVVNQDLYFANGLAIDIPNNKLYWVDAFTNLIETSDLEGNNRTVLFTGWSTLHFFGLALFENTLYLTDWGPLGSSSDRSYIREFLLGQNGTNVTQIGSIAERLNDVHAYHEKVLDAGPNGCGSNNGGCSEICLPLPSNMSQCACADGRRLSANKMSCEDGPPTITTPRPSTTTPTGNAACGGNYTALNGTIQSPNFPNKHANRLNCTYLIMAPEGYRITLNFTFFDVESSLSTTSCAFDYVEIRDGKEDTAPRYGRYCGVKLPPIQRSFGNYLYVRFFTDSSITKTGFQATYTAERRDNYFLLMTSSGRTNRVNDGSIFRVDPDTISNYRVPITETLDNPVALDYDPVEQRIYWTESSASFKRIRSCNLNGTNVQNVFTASSNAVLDGIEVDPLSRLIFYTDAGNKLVAMLTMTLPRRHKTIASRDVDQPRAIVLDKGNGVLYWSDWGTEAKIERANYDGSDRRTVVTQSLTYTNALAIDVPGNKLYWADAGTDKIENSDLDGNYRSVLYESGSSSTHFFGLTLFRDTLYLTDWGQYASSSTMSYILESVLTANGTMNLRRIGSISERLNDIHAYHPHNLDSGPNGCGSNNGGCSAFCIPLPSNRSKCECPDGQMVSSNGTGCDQATVIGTTTTTPRTTPPLPAVVYTHINPSQPPPFITDGSRELTLTCVVNPLVPVLGYQWSVPCYRRERNLCVLKPNVSYDGTTVTCTATLPDGRSSLTSGFHITLNYPPTQAPVISGYDGRQVKQPGERLRMTCSVAGGRPLVHAVLFSCYGYPDNTSDVLLAQEVQSILDIPSLRAQDNRMLCECTANWRERSLYTLSASITVLVNTSAVPTTTIPRTPTTQRVTTTAAPPTRPPLPDTTEVPKSPVTNQTAGQNAASQSGQDSHSSTAAIVGGVVGVGVVLIIVLVIIVFLVFRKRRRQPREDREVIVSDPPPEYQAPEVNFGNLGNSPFAMFNPAYDTPGAVGGAGVTESVDNSRNAAVDNTGEFNKVPLDPSQEVSASPATKC